MTNPLDEAWARVNALDVYAVNEHGLSSAITSALAIIEGLGGMDPALRERRREGVQRGYNEYKSARMSPTIATETDADCVLVSRETLRLMRNAIRILSEMVEESSDG